MVGITRPDLRHRMCGLVMSGTYRRDNMLRKCIERTEDESVTNECYRMGVEYGG